ncbi:LpqJ [Mycobacterium tuberculosis]|nr:LpqJ [Mycobacterium tuberculosis]
MTRCQINRNSVGCEAPFTNSPLRDGEHANGIHITAGGSVQWVLGNLGAIPTVSIDYRTYEAQGWTIDATTDGTRFTNNRTGHGMFVSIEKVDTF